MTDAAEKFVMIVLISEFINLYLMYYCVTHNNE